MSGDDVRMAPGPDGRLYVVVRGEGTSTIIGLDARGRLLAGWPRALTDWTDCWIGVVKSDGSVRLVCRSQDGTVRAFAFSPHARRLDGWPVNVTAAAGKEFSDYDHYATASDEPRIVGNRLFILLQRWDGDQALKLVRISAGGRATDGKAFLLTGGKCVIGWVRALGADGTAFAVRQRTGSGCSGDDASKIWAFGIGGVRAGWPVTVSGMASGPVVGPEGRVYVVRSVGSSSARIRVFRRDGTRIDAWSPLLRVEPSSAWYGAGGWTPAPPVVAADGSAWLVGGPNGAYSATPYTKAYALTARASVRPGWPWRSQATVSLRGMSSACDTGWGSLRVEPVAGPGRILYIALEPATEAAGGRVVALEPDGDARHGWPITLARPGSRFRSVEIGATGTVYALAIELERWVRVDGCRSPVNSATILAIAPGGSILYRRTVVAP
jgi:hypothetical protein